MTNYGRVRSATSPQLIEITPNAVFIAKDITEYEETIDNHTLTVYEYEYIKYTKDEYLLFLAQQNQELSNELAATKIVLGVE